MSNISWLDNVTGPESMVYGVNNMTNGGFFMSLIISISLIAFMALRAANRGIDEIFIYIGALDFLIAVYAIANNYIPFSFIMLPVALLVAGIILNRMEA